MSEDFCSSKESVILLTDFGVNPLTELHRVLVTIMSEAAVCSDIPQCCAQKCWQWVSCRLVPFLSSASWTPGRSSPYLEPVTFMAEGRDRKEKPICWEMTAMGVLRDYEGPRWSAKSVVQPHPCSWWFSKLWSESQALKPGIYHTHSPSTGPSMSCAQSV